MRRLAAIATLLFAVSAILAFLRIAGPGMLAFARPLLGLLPPGAVLQGVTGFVTTGPLQLGAFLVALGLGRLRRIPAPQAAAAAALAVLVAIAWEVAEVGVTPALSVGADFLCGRLSGFVVAIGGAAAACRLGDPGAKGVPWRRPPRGRAAGASVRRATSRES